MHEVQNHVLTIPEEESPIRSQTDIDADEAFANNKDFGLNASNDDDDDDEDSEHDLSDDSHIFPTPEDRTRVMALLASLGATRIEVAFSGGGDSGEVQGATLLDAVGNEIPMPDHQILGWEIQKSDYGVVPKTRTAVPRMMSIDKLLIQMTYDALEETNLDWYNNEGGGGELTIDFRETPPLLQLTVDINYTSTDTHGFNY